MTLSPLWDSHWIVILHALAALLAILLGAIQLATQKGTAQHQALGRVWVFIMAGVALSSFAIHEIRMLGPFSFIHLLSLLVLYSLWEAINAARKGEIAKHKTTMVRLYALGLILTGAFTLLPGRVMYRVFFS